ncbi:Uncharacterised protein [Mycobacteroides abscessus subsp. massiliense]|nr:Uncharacterised protein [Mycobacteroides abscessus subsp. massiliense]SKH92770.1 Uncharacterised protein [Mycobacteroides abscessus subsp. massiliense]SKI13226.1 Uncharacterised protein [Mycobacteroides abscessus subsp. massiliense]SKJ98804.1 Uncharacterised protein [Mycobacteroides abscessus subsp. massiliense]SKK28659.1 Uncharacterised protein [Mycobacteroides abscessus subsp. massiliense]
MPTGPGRMMVAVDDTGANNPADSEADYATAAQRFARSALNQLRDRASSQALLDSMTRLAEVTDPADTSGFKLMSGSHARSAVIRESLAATLAARDAAEPRRVELPVGRRVRFPRRA